MIAPLIPADEAERLVDLRATTSASRVSSIGSPRRGPQVRPASEAMMSVSSVSSGGFAGMPTVRSTTTSRFSRWRSAGPGGRRGQAGTGYRSS